MVDMSAEERDMRAAEFVLGTLDGEQRRAFEKQMDHDPALRDLVNLWEARLVGLNDTTSVVQPPQRVWMEIERVIAPGAVDDAAQAPLKTPWWQSLVLWRMTTAAALLALLAVLVPVLTQGPVQGPEALPVYDVVLRDTQDQPQWMVVCDWRTREVAVSRVAAAAPAAGKAHELWLVRGEGVAPISLGVLSGNEIQRSLPANATWRDTKALAVSLEPAGGSPTGVPTGPVLYAAPVSI